MRNDSAAEEAAEEVRTAGAEPVLVRGNVASERVISELAAHGPYAAVVHNAATGVIRSALETDPLEIFRGGHLDVNAFALGRANTQQRNIGLERLTQPGMELNFAQPERGRRAHEARDKQGKKRCKPSSHL